MHNVTEDHPTLTVGLDHQCGTARRVAWRIDGGQSGKDFVVALPEGHSVAHGFELDPGCIALRVRGACLPAVVVVGRHEIIPVAAVAAICGVREEWLAVYGCPADVVEVQV